MLWLLALSVASAAPCESPEALAEQSLGAVVEARLSDSRMLLDRTVQAWSCSPAASPQTVARYWLAEAALASFSSDDDGATKAFAAARTLAPELWDDRLGDQLKQAWLAAGQPSGTGTLTVSPAHVGPAVLDGSAVEEEPIEAATGLHLLQIMGPGEQARFARTLHVQTGQVALVRTGLTAPTEIPVPATVTEPVIPELPDEPPEDAPARTTPVWLVAAGTAAVVGTAGAIAARSQRSAIEEAATVEAVDSALLQQKVMAGIAYTGAGVAVVSVGLHFGTRAK